MATYGQGFNALAALAANITAGVYQKVANATKADEPKKAAEISKKMAESAEKAQSDLVKKEEAENKRMIEEEKKAKADKEAIQKRNRYFLYAGGAFLLYSLLKNGGKSGRS